MTTTVFPAAAALMPQHSKCTFGLVICVAPVATFFHAGLQSMSAAPILGANPDGLNWLINSPSPAP